MHDGASSSQTEKRKRGRGTRRRDEMKEEIDRHTNTQGVDVMLYNCSTVLLSDSLWPKCAEYFRLSPDSMRMSNVVWLETECVIVVAITRALHLAAPLYLFLSLFNLLDNIHFDINLFAAACRTIPYLPLQLLQQLLLLCASSCPSQWLVIPCHVWRQASLCRRHLTRDASPFNNISLSLLRVSAFVCWYVFGSVRRFSFYVRFLLCIINVYALHKWTDAMTQQTTNVVELMNGA